MNINEAIEFEESELERLNERLDFEKHSADVTEDDMYLKTKTYHLNQVSVLEKIIKQKNIALESMKLVQKQTHSYPQGIVLGNRWLTQEEIDRLGLRENK